MLMIHFCFYVIGLCRARHICPKCLKLILL